MSAFLIRIAPNQNEQPGLSQDISSATRFVRGAKPQAEHRGSEPQSWVTNDIPGNIGPRRIASEPRHLMWQVQPPQIMP
jgi:hypothetical protein